MYYVAPSFIIIHHHDYLTFSTELYRSQIQLENKDKGLQSSLFAKETNNIIDKFCSSSAVLLILVFALYTHPLPTNLYFLGCFSAPCGQI